MDDRYEHNPQILRVYLYYRLILASVLLLMFETGLGNNVLGKDEPELFRWTTIFYALLSLGSLYVFRPSLLTRSLHRITLLLVIDLIVILLVIHASGGTGSGLGYLLLVCTAMASIFIYPRLALAYAALITLFLIGETLYITKEKAQLSQALFATGILATLVFATTITFSYLTAKIRASDIEAARQAKYAKHLEELAQHIVTRMRTGVIVVADNNDIELINDAALQLFDMPPDQNYIGQPLANIDGLEELLKEWRRNPAVGVPRVHELSAGKEARINFATLDTGSQPRTILYIEDHRALVQQAQQLKLASLGRLTASIAHEVRNPLGAISHAAQLLSESDNADSGDIRLTEIIQQHSRRVNQIVENTMHLSRRREPKPEMLDLSQWVPHFINNFRNAVDCNIDLRITKHRVWAKADPSHLEQVLTNLIENGVRHSQLKTGKREVKVRCDVNDTDHSPYIEVIDFGEGVPDKHTSQIFDPFFTTDEKGTGLGLYISKELCEINQAALHYQRTADQESCFKISFSHHQRKIEL